MPLNVVYYECKHKAVVYSTRQIAISIEFAAVPPWLGIVRVGIRVWNNFCYI